MKTALLKSAKYGWGVQATEDVKAGEVVEIAPGKAFNWLTSRILNVLPGIGPVLYDSECESEPSLDTVLGFGLASYYNHDDDPNVDYEVCVLINDVSDLDTVACDCPAIIVFTALRDIKEGDELFIDYGEDYDFWEDT